MTPKTRLRINTETLGDIRQVIEYLRILEQAYNHLYAFDFIIADAKRRHKELNNSHHSPWGSSKPVRAIPSIRKPEDVVLPEDCIQINSIVIESPGFWEFLATINPLEVLRRYLCDRHERKKDTSYRNQQEEARGALENERFRTKVVQEKIEILRELGVPEEKIRKALFDHVIKPLGELDAVQDRGLIVDAEIIEGGSDNQTDQTTQS